MTKRTEYFSIWLHDFAEWLGSTATVTPVDALHANTALLDTPEFKGTCRNLSLVARRARKPRPSFIPLWRTRVQARVEIRAFEPETYEPGAEYVRLYGHLTREEVRRTPRVADEDDSDFNRQEAKS